MSHYFDVKRSANFTGVHVSALYTHIRNGRLPFKIVRGKYFINEADLIELYPAADAGKKQKLGLAKETYLSKDTIASLEKMLQDAIASKNYKVVSSIAITLEAAKATA